MNTYQQMPSDKDIEDAILRSPSLPDLFKKAEGQYRARIAELEIALACATAEREAILRKAARAVCPWCAEGNRPIMDEVLEHYMPELDHVALCTAAGIYAMIKDVSAVEPDVLTVRGRIGEANGTLASGEVSE